MSRHWVLIPAFALGTVSCAGAPRSVAPASVEVQRSFYLMGTSLDVTLWGPSRGTALDASEEIFRAVREDERRLSTWGNGSELARVNRAPIGRPVRLSPLLDRDLRNAERFAEATDFAFTPWIGPLVAAWGLRGGGRIPAPGELESARLAARPGAFRWSESGFVKARPGARIEEGGFGKGIGLDDAVARLAALGIPDAVLDFGGQVSVYGARQVPIEISDPENRERTLVRFETGAGSVSTSGNSEHGMRVRVHNGYRRIGHILDPRTGGPAAYDGSVTVVAPNGVEADCLSTGLFVMGPDRALEWARRHGAKVLWIIPDQPSGRWIARPSCAWEAPLETVSPNVEIRYECKTQERKS